ARCNGNSRARIGAFEMAIAIQGEQRQFFISQRGVNLLNVVENVALRREKVLPAIVVKIFQPYTPAGAAGSKSAEAGLKTLIGECARAIIVIQAVEFARQNGDDDVGTAVIVVILKDRPHAGKAFAIGGERRARLQSAFVEGA